MQSANSSSKPSQLLIMAASTRTGSLNRSLAVAISDRLVERGESVSLIDLAKYGMPLYQGDLEAIHGVPTEAAELAAVLSTARSLVLVSPEYNGSFPPLLKNTIDWITRIDTQVIAHLDIRLASASPGKGGGARGLEMIRNWFANMGIQVASHSLSVGRATLGPRGAIEVDPIRIDTLLGLVAGGES